MYWLMIFFIPVRVDTYPSDSLIVNKDARSMYLISVLNFPSVGLHINGTQSQSQRPSDTYMRQ